MLAAGCASSQAAEPAVKPIEPTRPAAVTPAPHPVRRLVVIQARVDSRRRIVSGNDATLALGASAEALARELAPQGILARGTEVRAVYETTDAPASRSGNRHLVALRVGSGPTARVAVVVDDGGAASARAYSLDGRPVGTALLRYPVAHLQVTSGFTSSRKHPITKKRKPHLAVDFAAPYGTPVVAVADGEVALAKWSGGFGRLVRIAHEGGYESAYAHLQRYATGIKAGAHVSKGQLIGYVGSSGLATGPHLHFALLHDGQPIDPLGAGLPTLPRLAGDALVALRDEATQVGQILAAADREDVATTRLASARR